MGLPHPGPKRRCPGTKVGREIWCWPCLLSIPVSLISKDGIWRHSQYSLIDQSRMKWNEVDTGQSWEIKCWELVGCVSTTFSKLRASCSVFKDILPVLQDRVGKKTDSRINKIWPSNSLAMRKFTQSLQSSGYLTIELEYKYLLVGLVFGFSKLIYSRPQAEFLAQKHLKNVTALLYSLSFGPHPPLFQELPGRHSLSLPRKSLQYFSEWSKYKMWSILSSKPEVSYISGTKKFIPMIFMSYLAESHVFFSWKQINRKFFDTPRGCALRCFSLQGHGNIPCWSTWFSQQYSLTSLHG